MMTRSTVNVIDTRLVMKVERVFSVCFLSNILRNNALTLRISQTQTAYMTIAARTFSPKLIAS